MVDISMPTFRSDYIWLQKIARAMLIITAILVFVPLNPVMPGTDLDASFKFGINRAIEQNLVFGKDIVFTYGPYASIYTRLYDPATDHIIMFASLFLGLATAIVVYKLAQSRSIIWHLLFTAFLASGTFLPDPPILFLYPLLITLFIYQLTIDKKIKDRLSFKSKILYILLFLPFGLIFLIKGSSLVHLGAVTFLSAVLFWRRNMKKMAISICVSPLLSILFFLKIAGQPVTGLWYYLKNISPIISGYTEAMAVHGEKRETILFLVTASVITLFCYRLKKAGTDSRLFLLLTTGLLLFTAFKAGFVRHDGHAIVGATTVFLIGFLLYTVIEHRYLPIILGLSAITWLYISYNYMGPSVFNMFRPVPAIYTESLDGLMIRISNKGILQQRYHDRLNEIRKDQGKVQTLKGTTDFYFYELTYLLASENTWSPRPVIQSYQAYTKELAEMNEAHLTGTNAPNNIILRLQTIDNRYPSLDDGLSWPTIINNYSPVNNENGFLYLSQKKPKNISPKKTEIYTLTGNIGSEVMVPDTTQMLFAQLDIEKTMLGGLFITMYQPDPVDMYVTLVDGTELKYRLIPRMAQSGFIISPLITSNEELSLLFNDKAALKNKRVKSFRITNDALGLRSLFNSWKPAYTIHLSKIDFDN
jgi:hypothetical protein